MCVCVCVCFSLCAGDLKSRVYRARRKIDKSSAFTVALAQLEFGRSKRSWSFVIIHSCAASRVRIGPVFISTQWQPQHGGSLDA